MGIGAILILLKRWKWGQLAAWICTSHLHYSGRWVSFYFRVLRRFYSLVSISEEIEGEMGIESEMGNFSVWVSTQSGYKIKD